MDKYSTLFGTGVRRFIRIIVKIHKFVLGLEVVILLINLLISWMFMEKEEVAFNYGSNHKVYHMNIILFITEGVLSNLLFRFMLFYVNVDLKKATYERDILSVKYWLVMYVMTAIYLLVMISCQMLLKNDYSVYFVYVWIKFAFFLFSIYVVKNFYRDELENSITTFENFETTRATTLNEKDSIV